MTPPKEAVSFFEQAFVRRGRAPLGALVTWAEGPKGFISGYFRFVDEETAPRPSRDYGELKLHERWVPADAALPTLEATLSGAAEADGGLGFLKFDYGRYERRVGRSDNFTRWPEWVLEARPAGGRSDTGLSSGMAVSHGLPPFSSVHRAIDDWLWGERFSNRDGETRHFHELVVAVADIRGMLGEVRWKGNRLSGTVHSAGVAGELELQTVLTTDAGRQILPSQTPSASVFHWDTPADARSAEVFLVHSSRDLMGYAQVSPGATVMDPSEQLPPSEQAARDLAGGENDRVEFKPFVVPKSDKEAELIETVIAFANTFGGRLYVGVRDDGEPEGEMAFRRIIQGDKVENEEKYLAFLKGLFRERVKPVPPLNIEFVGVAGHRVIMVTVEAGHDRPYSGREHQLFIRKGASNMRPDPKTELPRLYERERFSLLSTSQPLFGGGLF